jgi:hypothetical protein
VTGMVVQLKVAMENDTLVIQRALDGLNPEA